MQHIKPAYFIQGFVWSFAKDGGDMKSYNTGITIPAGALVVLTTVQNVTTCVGGGSSFGVGITGSTTKYGSYAAAAYGTNRIIFASSVSILEVATGDPILLTISGARVTDGKLKFFMEYFFSSPND